MKSEPSAGRVAWPCIATGAAGALFTIFCFYPGYMSPDSFSQLRQARTGDFTDWHPPLMSLLWRVLDRIYPGPAGMLVLHSLLFWSAVTLLCCTLARRAGPVFIAVFGLFPPVIAILGTIWKDVGFGASLLLAYALLVYSLHQSSKAAWVAGLLPFLYGIGVRHNAVFAAIPLSIFAGYVGSTISRKYSTRRAGIVFGIVLLVGSYTVAAFVNAALVGGHKTYIYQTILMHDLVAISISEGRVRLPAWTYGGGQPPTVAELQAIYSPALLTLLFVGNTPSARLQESTKVDDIRELRNAWLTAVRGNPRAYLLHRWNAFKALLGIEQVSVCYPYQYGITPNEVGLAFHPSTINSMVMNVLERLKNTILFRGWFYVLITSLALGISPWLRQGIRLPIITLGASAILYQAPYFFLTPTCDFRYNWWSVLTTLCILVHLGGTFLTGRGDTPVGLTHDLEGSQ